MLNLSKSPDRLPVYWAKLALLMFLLFINHHLNAQVIMKNEIDSTAKMIGSIQKEIIVGKDQRTTSYEDYYFVEKGSSERIFIKCPESKVEKKVLDSLLSKRSDQVWVSGEVEITATFRKGPWDGADKMHTNVDLHRVPGRNGKYLRIESIGKAGGNEHQELEGKIIKSVQVNKAGRKLKTYDLFFRTGKEQYYIKSREQTVSRKELESLLKENKDGSYESGTVRVHGEIKNGLWDTDDPKVQSRVGKYILIYKIVN